MSRTLRARHIPRVRAARRGSQASWEGRSPRLLPSHQSHGSVGACVLAVDGSRWAAHQARNKSKKRVRETVKLIAMRRRGQYPIPRHSRVAHLNHQASPHYIDYLGFALVRERAVTCERNAHHRPGYRGTRCPPAPSRARRRCFPAAWRASHKGAELNRDVCWHRHGLAKRNVFFTDFTIRSHTEGRLQ